MTLVAVYNDAVSTHLISDSLISTPIENFRDHDSDNWLSTGIFLNNRDQIKYKFSEGALKICEIQHNLVIGFSGDVKLSFEAISILKHRSNIEKFSSFSDIKSFIYKSLIPSIIPTNRSFSLCGFFASSGITTKFKLRFDNNRIKDFQSSAENKTVYAIGSGTEEFKKIWRRIPPLENRKDVDPQLTFSLIAEHLYMKQFIREIDLITEKYIGGAITGIYYFNGMLTWQSSRSTLIFANFGGTGFEARFKWLPIVYKTWYQRGNVFSSSMFEKKKSFFQIITKYSNPFSKPINLDSYNLFPEMKTFNAKSLNIILLPKGISNVFPAVIRVSGKMKPFDEIIENDRIVGLRLNKDFFNKLTKRFFIASDYTVKMGLDMYLPLIGALHDKINQLSNINNQIELISLKEELAVRLIEYGDKTNNIKLYSDALDCFLSAWEIAIDCDHPIIEEVDYNISNLLNNIRKNLNKQQQEIILRDHIVSLNKYNNQKIKLLNIK